MLCLNRVDGALKEEPEDGALKEEPSFDLIPVSIVAEPAQDQPSQDQPAPEDPPNETCYQPAMLPGPLLVHREDDIIGAGASIVYEDCLRQLASLLLLPVKKCAVILSSGAMCDCAPPFEINITPKGTAMNVEWVNLDDHCMSYL